MEATQKFVTLDDIFALFSEERKLLEQERAVREEEHRKTMTRIEQDRIAREQERIESKKRLEELEAKYAAEKAERDRVDRDLLRDMGRFRNALGRWSEDYFARKLVDNFCALGFNFKKNSGRTKFYRTGNPNNFAEVDFYLENGNYVLLGEVKSDFTPQDLAETIEKFHEIGSFLREEGEHRKIIGAVAGMAFGSGVEVSALKQGFYVIAQNGENTEIRQPNEPVVW